MYAKRDIKLEPFISIDATNKVYIKSCIVGSGLDDTHCEYWSNKIFKRERSLLSLMISLNRKLGLTPFNIYGG